MMVSAELEDRVFVTTASMGMTTVLRKFERHEGNTIASDFQRGLTL